MKKIILVALALLVPATAVMAKKKKEEVKKDSVEFTVIKQNPITSVKDQHRSGTCWAYSSLGFLEAELLRMGKGEHDLCESFLVYNTYMDRADKAIRTHGDASFSQGGSFYDAIYCLKHYGIVPQDAMPFPGSLYGDSLFNFNQLDAVASAYVSAIAKGNLKKISPTWKSDLSNIYKNYFGELPKTVVAGGKTYTPQQYATDYLGLNPDDYVSLTSYTHHPFYTKFILEIQDNWRWAESYNLPLDEFMEVCDAAVRNGYTFAWGADVSESYFSRDGVARVPATLKDNDLTGSDAARWTGSNAQNGAAIKTSNDEKTITQELRQLGYDNWETTDDHGMVIYGLAKNKKGDEYFMVKNSWGDYGKYHGMFYASKAYVAYKTMNILIHKSAIPAHIAKKLGL
ncbi:MAG: C1 family peptidase [Bacteroidales bacterium]|nr:C1 family peptidase [Bacteroidales bacterium]